MRLATLAQVFEKPLLDGVAWAWQNDGHGNSSWGSVSLGGLGIPIFIPFPSTKLAPLSASELRTVV
jgi:hypothetical protein